MISLNQISLLVKKRGYLLMAYVQRHGVLKIYRFS